MFSWLLIPGLAAWGYVLRVLKETSEGAEEPGPFEDWGELIADGLMSIVIAIVYAIVPFAIYFVMLTVILGGAQAGGDAGGLLAGFGVVGFLLALVLFFVVQYILPAALTNYAREDSFGAAFDFKALKPVLLSNQYIIATLLLVAVVGIVLPTVIFVIGTITFGIGFLLLAPVMPFVYFWMYLVGAYMFGSAFGDVKDSRITENVEEGEGVAV